MTTVKLLGCLLLVASLFVLTQSPGWQFSYLALSAAFGFTGLVLVTLRPPRASAEYRKRARQTYLDVRMGVK